MKYTWGPHSLLIEDADFSTDVYCTCGDPFRRKDSLLQRSFQESGLRSISFDKNTSSKETEYVKEHAKSVVFMPSIHKDDDILPSLGVPRKLVFVA